MISEEPEEINSLHCESQLNLETPALVASHSHRQHRASISGKKLSGRPSMHLSISTQSVTRQIPKFHLAPANSEADSQVEATQNPQVLLSRVVSWLHEEKAKRVHRKFSNGKNAGDDASGFQAKAKLTIDQHDQAAQDALALDQLEHILGDFAPLPSGTSPSLVPRVSTPKTRKSSTSQKLKRGASVAVSSDTEYQDTDLLVPNVEVVLDNSKAMWYSGGINDESSLVKTKTRERDGWINFKQEIVRLTHTLRLKGWRRVPIDEGENIDVERLSGALTNAVYVVSPPKNLPQTPAVNQSTITIPLRRTPKKLLLRVYGPQVEHLIDRQGELAILRRLARKRIGPRLLGTFTNGRFEEFFHARTLTAADLRLPETSKQIAKRMRELHDGIELLEEEREGGPFLWKNWDKWVDRCEQVITWLDKQILLQRQGGRPMQSAKRYTRQGFICGVEWPVFRRAVDRYRKYLEVLSGGKAGLKQQLVFAHNDVGGLQ